MLRRVNYAMITKVVVGLSMFGLWTLLAFMGKAPFDPLVEFIKNICISLGTYMLAMSEPKKSPPPPTTEPKP